MLLQMDIAGLIDSLKKEAVLDSMRRANQSTKDLIIDNLSTTEIVLTSLTAVVVLLFGLFGLIALYKSRFKRDKTEIIKDTKVFDSEGKNAETESTGGLLELNQKLEEHIAKQSQERLEVNSVIADMSNQLLIETRRTNELQSEVIELKTNQKNAFKEAIRIMKAICKEPVDVEKVITEIAVKYEFQTEDVQHGQ